MNALFRALVLAMLMMLTAAVGAHEMSMAEMQLYETSRGEFLWQWSATNDKNPSTENLTLLWPEGCVAESNVLHCGDKGLQGTLAIEGVGKRYSAALVKVFWLDGQSRVYTLTAGQPTVHLYGSADDKRGMGEITSAYTVLGIEHILSGWDHLLFVTALLFLVGFRRKLVWTITAFTAAHSLTLASAALGWLTLRSAPVEACIALSIVLVAYEALNRKNTLPKDLPARAGSKTLPSPSGRRDGDEGRDATACTPGHLSRQWPALVAFLFGLVHGLGFAGALKDIGLPENHLLVALLTFNVGVELGQLMAVAAAWLLWRVAVRWPPLAKLRTVLLYGIGSVAAFWSWLRVMAIFSN